MTKKALKVFITEEEDLELMIKMDRLGYKYKSEFIKDSMLNNYIYQHLYKLVASEINKTGNNLNQIAKYANTEKQLDKDVLSALLKIDVELSKILFMIKDNTK